MYKVQNIIDYITENTKLKQIDIAKKLGVSRAQISMWRKDETMSSGRNEQLFNITGLPGDFYEWGLFCRTHENDKNWTVYLNDCISKTRLHYEFMEDDKDSFYLKNYLFHAFKTLGLNIPNQPPKPGDIFDKFMEAVISLYSEVAYWYALVLSLRYIDNSDVYDVIHELESYLPFVTIHKGGPKLLKVYAINDNDSEIALHSQLNDFSYLLANLIVLIQDKGLVISHDFYDLIYLTPDELVIDLDLTIKQKNKPTSYSDFLPIGEKLILREIASLKKKLK